MGKSDRPKTLSGVSPSSRCALPFRVIFFDRPLSDKRNEPAFCDCTYGRDRKAILYVSRRFNLTATGRTVDGSSRSCRSRLDLIESRTVLPEERRPSLFHLVERTSRSHIKQRAAITSGIGSRRRGRIVDASYRISSQHLPGPRRDERDNGRLKLHLAKKLGAIGQRVPFLIADWTFVADQWVARSFHG